MSTATGRDVKPGQILRRALGLLVAVLLHLTAAAQGPASDGRGPGVMESRVCARCHSNSPRASAMRDAEGHGIAPYDLWRGTLMANSARDPLWRAVVSAEIAATPSKRGAIETKCLSCHAPMAHRAGLDDHDTGTLLHVLECDSDPGRFARDGVSCTICHGMTAAGLGREESFSAGFELDANRRLFGPHEGPFAMPMRHQTGFTPTYGSHVQSSAMCGSCHTLETEALDAEGRAVGVRFLEQAPYLEWRNSEFGRSEQTCQACHLPTLEEDGEAIRTRIARNPGGRNFPPTRPREPFGQHVLVGGNTLVLSLFRDHGEELRVEAPPAAFQAALEATREQLQQRTASVSIADVRIDGSTLAFEVDVENLTGHKLPTGHPSRRAWLRAVVRDARGGILFASGTTDSMGRVVGSEGQPLPSELVGGPIEPHRNTVRTPDQVATYEGVMADARGEPTHVLLRGAAWHVDDRLLPRGWLADAPEVARIAPAGTDDDMDFVGGADRVLYRVDLGLREPPATIEVALLYQSFSARWAAELLQWSTPEVERFEQLYASADHTPEVLASARWRSP